jgi:hypothetical protein
VFADLLACVFVCLRVRVRFLERSGCRRSAVLPHDTLVHGAQEVYKLDLDNIINNAAYDAH